MQQIKDIPNAMLSQLTANYIEDPDDLSSPCLFTNREKGYASSQVSTLHQHGSSNRHRNNILAVLFFSNTSLSRPPFTIGLLQILLSQDIY